MKTKQPAPVPYPFAPFGFITWVRRNSAGAVCVRKPRTLSGYRWTWVPYKGRIENSEVGYSTPAEATAAAMKALDGMDRIVENYLEEA